MPNRLPNRLPLAAFLTLTLPLLTHAQSTKPTTTPAHPVETLLATLKDQLAFIDKERPDLTQIQALQLGLPNIALLRSPAGVITGGTYQYEFNMTPNTKTEPSHPIAENLTALRVYIAIYTNDPAHPAAANRESLAGPTLAWDKKATARHYHIANTPWLLTIHIEGNRPALLEKINDTADKRLNAFITTQQPALPATRPTTLRAADTTLTQRAEEVSPFREPHVSILTEASEPQTASSPARVECRLQEHLPRSSLFRGFAIKASTLLESRSLCAAS